MTKRDPATGPGKTKQNASDKNRTVPTLGDIAAEIRSRVTIDRPVSIEEMDEAIRAEAWRRNMSDRSERLTQSQDNPEPSLLDSAPECFSSTRNPDK